MRPTVTLTTDFGTRDPFAGAMKGVVLSRCPDAAIVDLSHDVSPHDVLEVALFVAAAVPYFPPGTVHVVVVDPGVGTARRPLAARCGDQFVVGPDNGFATLLWESHPPSEVREITSFEPPAGQVSATFHGRDVFAPVAAALASGADLSQLGPVLVEPVRLSIPRPRFEEGRWLGEVIHIDRFGNAMTNLRQAELGGQPYLVQAAGAELGSIRRTYGDAAPGEALALFGSAGYLEIAVNQGRADEAPGLQVGDPVEARPV
jgi:S-adenosyl-L-methionine hydrolase (adenosine-forming)